MTERSRTDAGGVIASALAAVGVDRVFLVPGESYLPVMNGLETERIEAVVCRNEGGAAYMAVADAMLTGAPGVAMVTRGPGAANAMIGVSAAWQDGIPIVLFVGLIPTVDRDRDSFQEFDLRGWFGTTTKRVFVLDAPSRAQAVVEEAMRVAMVGRPGPVVVGLPEDVLAEPAEMGTTAATHSSPAVLGKESVREIAAVFEGSERPLILVGGFRWSAEAGRELARFAERHAVPVLGDFRAGDRLPASSRANAGWVGFGAPGGAAQLLAGADALLVLGTALGEVVTQGWRQRPPENTVVVNPDPELRGHIFAPRHHLVADPIDAARVLAGAEIEVGAGWVRRMEDANEAYLQSLRPPLPESADGESAVRVAEVIEALNRRLPEHTTVAYGAGQHCIWPQRFLKRGAFPAELGLRSGSMGFSVPAAAAAALRQPDRLVVCVAGDGELLMNGQELATVARSGVGLLLVIVDNCVYGTILAHQQRMFCGRRFGVDLQNPDFAALVRAFGGEGYRIEASSEVEGAVEAAVVAAGAGHLAALHVIADENDNGE